MCPKKSKLSIYKTVVPSWFSLKSSRMIHLYILQILTGYGFNLKKNPMDSLVYLYHYISNNNGVWSDFTN